MVYPSPGYERAHGSVASSSGSTLNYSGRCRCRRRCRRGGCWDWNWSHRHLGHGTGVDVDVEDLLEDMYPFIPEAGVLRCSGPGVAEMPSSH